ncbi:hypothetical protein CXB49_13665 [Chromobacterium sp. ATCC 53434]|nr:hypothetical protein CXB49_13665 [Chromobacterium sp. ATCC 53434]
MNGCFLMSCRTRTIGQDRSFIVSQFDWSGVFGQCTAECTAHPCEVAEHALTHYLPDKVEAAYQHRILLENAANLWPTGVSALMPARPKSSWPHT